jgi:6-phosphogluconolactonase (cycloisomerase 2 family)
MRRSIRLSVGAGVLLGLSTLLTPLAAGAEGLGTSDVHAVFVQTNDTAGNQVVVYRSGAHGGLSFEARYNTGGLGVALTGAVVDKLASQGSLAFDASAQALVAVNGGSESITEFHVDGARLIGRRSVASGGSIPVSVAVSGNRLYVLNAGGTGSVQGFYVNSLHTIAGSHRNLNLTPDVTPQYLNTPGQIGLTPDGRQLIVTTKANGSDIDVFGVSPNGALSATPTVNSSATPVPFGFTFNPAGDLVVTEAGTSALTTYAVHGDGTLTELHSVTDGLAALCWVTKAGNHYFGANAGSATITGYRIGPGGLPTIIGETAADAGSIDLAAAPDGTALYVETGGADIVDAFSVHSNGLLSFTGSSVAPELPGHSGLEGIAVS